jgi:DNA polymerase I-like protein with 3'-5' exonuclease and polymerase domains
MEKEQLVVIRTLAQLEELKAYLSDKQFISYDTETDGVDKESRVIGFSVSADVNLGYYVILSYWDVAQQKLVDLETKHGASAFISGLVGKSLVMQNAGFDCAMSYNNFGVELMPSVHTDTMLLAHLLDENRPCGLKELGVAIFGEDARKEQTDMKESVHKNGGVLTKEKYELYKADADLIARYGAKDAILTLKLFYHLVPELFEQGLDKFFYEDETMPLARGPTYQLNTTGLRVDPEKLATLKSTLQAECLDAKAFIYKEIAPHVADKYPGTSKAKTFNIGASKQIAWLLFYKLENEFNTLTKGGRALCKALDIKVPYSPGAKREFLRLLEENKGREYEAAKWNPKTNKMGRPKKVADPWHYLSSGKHTLAKFAPRYKWVEKLLEHSRSTKLLNTYVKGIQTRMKYNVIRPNFLQHGTTSGRYSCKNPNFQNLPRDDKRVKSCIVARTGNVFVGADYSQLEPRVFASFSKDERLLAGFRDGDDFYSVVGVEVFDRPECSLKKKDPNFFRKVHEAEGNQSKIVALSATYGKKAAALAVEMGCRIDEAQAIIDSYFEKFPDVLALMRESHQMAKRDGVVYNLFGRPRRMPKATMIPKLFGKASHDELPYEWRNILNLAINHRIQSTGASIMNRAAIRFHTRCVELAKEDAAWASVRIVLQVHDELIAECPKALAERVAAVLKDAMEKTSQLPGVDLIAEPKIACDIASLK